MAFLLKIAPHNLSRDEAVVPRMKSAAITEADLGETLFIWLTDYGDLKSGLHGVTTLQSIEEIDLPQVRDPRKTKPAFRVQFSEFRGNVVSPLTTDDLEPYRYSEGDSGLERLGRLHRDRNEKIIRITEAEEDELASRFGT